MSRLFPARPSRWRTLTLVAMCLAVAFGPTWAQAAVIVLKDGRRLQGEVGKTSGLADDPLSDDSGRPASITLLDDQLRRVFIPTTQIRAIDEVNSGEIPERIPIRQRVAEAGDHVASVGPILKVQPFDEYGRRVLTMMTSDGPKDVVQGITLITPTWTKVEGLLTSALTPVVWDMRIATSSIPRETLHKILTNSTDPNNVDQRLRIVRLLLQSERYGDAQQELQELIADFPKKSDLADQVKAMKQLHARSIVQEIDVRRDAGQHYLAYNLLENFPTEGVAGETLQQVREMLVEYQDIQKKRDGLVADLKEQLAAVKDPSRHKRCEELLAELERELSMGNFDRMAAYFVLSGDQKHDPEQKLALAFSGWLMGSDYASTNLGYTLSLAEIRDLVIAYMNEPVKLKRDQLLSRMRGLEGADPLAVSRLIGRMKPPLETPVQPDKPPGFYRLQVPIGIDREPDAVYSVQLPPEYDPYVRYPTIVTLNGTGTTPENQVDWWAGTAGENGNRLGQASRHGFIVIAVDWLADGQREYRFSAREHATVLASLRDACRRFSIDTDRVFLSGHSAGGDAAWDIGLSHPDLWAGVIPIVATSRKYASHYWQNAELLPFYVVQGEKDGDKVKENARDLDRYMTHRFDVTVVEYQGRGHEDYYEEIQHLFDWMLRRQGRDFFPKEFEVSTMRTWDNYFWWLEVGKLPERSIVEPANWPPDRGTRAATLEGKLRVTGDIVVPTRGVQATVWLSPGMIDPTKQAITVSIGGRRQRVEILPDLGVMLEDVRTRGDRQHPFWARIEL
ncbi:MAG: peptidase [Planctomycetota bacterium]|nr:MAG: peptidase [Planctomycetota bacterium]